MADHVAHSKAFAGVVRSQIGAGGVAGVGAPAASRENEGGRGGPVPPRLADIGAGAGVPGLVLAEELPEVDVMLIERREGRATWLDEAAGALAGEGVSVRVRCADVYDLAHGAERARYDIVTARAFGSPAATAELGGALLRVGGVLVVSEPPDQPERWAAVDLEALGLVDGGTVDSSTVDSSTADGRVAGRDGARFRLLARRAPLGAHRPRRKPRP